MTLKEAQEVLEDHWRKVRYMIYSYEQESNSKQCSIILESTGNFIETLLEAARVVERERTFTILHEAAMRTENIQSLDLIEKLQFEILSDNQERNEGN